MYIVYVIVRARSSSRSSRRQLPKEQTNVPFLKTVQLLATSFFPLALLILAVLGTIMFGLATPTEAAAVGALGAVVLAAGYRALTWARLKEAVYLTARTSAMVCWLFVGSATFASIFAYLGGEGIIKEFVLGLDLSPIMFMILAQIIIFILGWPLEWTEIIIIFVPIFLPLLPHFGIDPLMFGILVALNLQTAFLSPPMAMAAFYLKGVAPPHVLLTQIFGGCMPFVVHRDPVHGVVYVFPGIVTWLPNADLRPLSAWTPSQLELALGDRRGARDPRRRDQRRAAGRRPASRACARSTPQVQAWAFLDPEHALAQAGARLDQSAARASRSGRCTACRSASRTSSTPPTCRPRTARCCTPGARRCTTPPWSRCCARRAR